MAAVHGALQVVGEIGCWILAIALLALALGLLVRFAPAERRQRGVLNVLFGYSR